MGLRCGQAHPLERALEGGNERLGDVRDDKVLPDRQTNFTGAVAVRQVRDAQHLLRHKLADRHGDTNVMEATLFLRKIADVRVRQLLAGPTESSLVQRRAAQRLAKFLFDLGKVIVEGHRLEQMLETRLLAVSAAAALDENPDDGGDD